jgi:hypothetical protein
MVQPLMWSRFALLLALVLVSAGCDAIGFVFKAGMWAGALAVILVVVLLVVVVMKVKR